MRDGAYLVANLVAYVAMKERAAEYGMPPEMLAKNDTVLEGGYRFDNFVVGASNRLATSAAHAVAEVLAGLGLARG